MRLKHKIETLMTNPKGVFKKYLFRVSYYPFSRGMPKPYLDEDYEKHWNHADFKQKKVLDLGADYGSTAAWFRKKGSREVIAVEAEKELYAKLEHYSENRSWLTVINEFIDSSNKIDQLVTNFNPQIVKVDIEGAEKNLLNCDKLADVSTWLIEAHSEQIRVELTSHFQRIGFSVRRVSDLGNFDILVIQK